MSANNAVFFLYLSHSVSPSIIKQRQTRSLSSSRHRNTLKIEQSQNVDKRVLWTMVHLYTVPTLITEQPAPSRALLRHYVTTGVRRIIT